MWSKVGTVYFLFLTRCVEDKQVNLNAYIWRNLLEVFFSIMAYRHASLLLLNTKTADN